jgi:hypothetical protein
MRGAATEVSDRRRAPGVARGGCLAHRGADGVDDGKAFGRPVRRRVGSARFVAWGRYSAWYSVNSPTGLPAIVARSPSLRSPRSSPETDLDEVVGALGSRGYRAAQLEAGVAAGRLARAAFTLGYGATGLTFYDEAVTQFFSTRAACMLVTAVGVPDYTNTPGGHPGAPTELARFGWLMERLSEQLQRDRF